MDLIYDDWINLKIVDFLFKESDNFLLLYIYWVIRKNS